MGTLSSKRNRAVVATLALVAAVIVAANGIVLSSAGANAKAARPEPRADCALVLGAGLTEDGLPSWVLEDRLTEALSLWERGRVAKILVSGDHHTAHYDEPNAMRRWLEARGVPPSHIFMDHAGLDTYSSVWRARHVFGASRVVVVTQRFHLARAVWLARQVGLEAEGSPADRRVYRGVIWHEVREVVSRTKAVFDISIARQPRHGGPPIPLEGDGRRATAG
jgi:SanA protein